MWIFFYSTGQDKTSLMPSIPLFETMINSAQFFEKCKLNRLIGYYTCRSHIELEWLFLLPGIYEVAKLKWKPVVASGYRIINMFMSV